MASASSSSGSGPNALRKHDVFISFRGEDTRYNFTGHLHAALKRAFLEVFLDEKKLEKGYEIKPELIQAIKDSSISVIVFSDDYASSKWCLDELAEIMECRKNEGQFVIPIFYKVEPRDVRNQTGAYEKAFEKHEVDYPTDRVSTWRAALSETGKLKGWHLQAFTDETKLIQEIVSDVSTKLERAYNCRGALKDVIGGDEMTQPIKELLAKYHKVVIWGMGGVGKTTMAKVVFAKLSSQYDSCCFLENVREETEKKGLKQVRDSLVSKLLGKDMQSDSSNEEFVRRRLCRTKAFAVLDDVVTTEQLKNLEDNICNFLGEGSKVIVTTRDKKLLKGRKDYEIYEAKGLSYENSRRLFIHKAFGSNNPEDGYEELIEGFVDYTKHNPLALEVLGSHVCSEDKQLWRELLRKLQDGNPDEEIQKVLRLSYDRLGRYEKQIFLDIACFLKGEGEGFVKELMMSYGFYPDVGMQTLKDKALINTIDGKVEMHDLIQEMAYQIVREESIDEPEKRSRLWVPSEISDVLKNCEGKNEVEGMILRGDSMMTSSDLTAKTFNKMKKLRFLKFCSRWFSPEGRWRNPILESISERIRYFCWESYPMMSLPSKFCVEHLLLLNLSCSYVETLWEGVQDLANLRRLKLAFCENLKELPDFSEACRLEKVDLRGCKSLYYVHESILSLHSLVSLDVRYCSNLRSLKSRIHLKSLKRIKIAGCRNLKKFSVSSEQLTSLDLSFTKIKELKPSIGHCSNLRTLNLFDTKLKKLPIKKLSCLTSLEKLSISDIQNIDTISLLILFDSLLSLQRLSLMKCCNLTKLPDNIMQLSKLQYLSVKGCTALQSLPELPPSLRELNATDCTSLETMSTSTISSTSENYGDKIFSFINCVKLDLDTIEEQAKLLLEKAVREKEHVIVCYPGKKVPEWFGNIRTQNDLDALKLSLFSNTLVGFLFCAILPDFLKEEEDRPDVETFFCVGDDEMSNEEVGFPEFKAFFHWFANIIPRDFPVGNIFLRSYPEASQRLLEEFEGIIGNEEAAESPNKIIKFSIYDYHSRKWGAYPIYASRDSELNPNSRKGKDIMM